jgi:hypothetical protein
MAKHRLDNYIWLNLILDDDDPDGVDIELNSKAHAAGHRRGFRLSGIGCFLQALAPAVFCHCPGGVTTGRDPVLRVG